MIKNYLLITLRSMTKNKLFIFINVFGIGIALACCIVAYINWEFNKNWDKIHVNADKIYRVQFWYEFQGNRDRYGMAPMPLGNYVKENFKDVSKVVRFIPSGSNFRIGDELFNTGVGYADSAFFELFTFELKHGTFADFADKSKIFISDEIAIKYFGKEDVVGQPLTQIIEGQPKEFLVGGVFKKQPLNSSFYSETFTLIDNYWDASVADKEAREDNWKRWNTLFLQIDEPERISAIEASLQQYIEPQNRAREDFKIKEYYLENFKGIGDRSRENPRLRNDWLRGGLPQEAITLPIVMAGFLLLIACFNFTNTSIAISSRRLKEIGIRKVMGSRRGQLVFQFLGENLLLCFFGLVVGLLMAEMLVPAYSSMWEWLDLKLNYAENALFILFLVGLLLVSALIAGGYPSVYITAFEPVTILKGKTKFGGTNWFTRILLGLQFSISLLTIIFAVAFYRNAEYQKAYDLGFSTTGVISTFVRDEGAFNTYRDALATNKDILKIGGTKNHIANTFYNDPVKFEDTEKEVDILDIGDGYFEAMDMSLVAGRNFKKDSQTDYKESVLITEEFVRAFGWTDDPIGKRVVWMDTVQLYVVGVIKNVYARALWEPIQPLMVRYIPPADYRQVVVTMAPENMKRVNEFMEAKWKEVFPNTVYNGQYIDQELAETNEINDNIVKMFSFLGFFAILLSATGLYTLVSLNIIKRMKEIGVRKVLGASIGNIARVINMEFIIILSLASVLGGVGGYYASNGLMDSIWEYYREVDLISFGFSVLIMFVISALAVSFKTISTASLNPTKTLRDE